MHHLLRFGRRRRIAGTRHQHDGTISAVLTFFLTYLCAGLALAVAVQVKYEDTAWLHGHPPEPMTAAHIAVFMVLWPVLVPVSEQE